MFLVDSGKLSEKGEASWMINFHHKQHKFAYQTMTYYNDFYNILETYNISKLVESDYKINWVTDYRWLWGDYDAA